MLEWKRSRLPLLASLWLALTAAGAPAATPLLSDFPLPQAAVDHALSKSPNWTVSGDHAYSNLGFSVRSAGDVNGDGYDDVIVGAPGYEFGVDSGRAFVYYGSPLGLSTAPSWEARGAPTQATFSFGAAVGTAGDVNGDGYADVIIGSKEDDQVFVYHGSPTGLAASPSWVATGERFSNFGFSVAAAGDVNGDGYDDVIISAVFHDNGQLDEGRAFVYLGSAAGLGATPAWQAEGDQENAYFGWSTSTAGDINGDGYADVIVGAPGFGPDGLFGAHGRAFVYHGSPSGLSAAAVWTMDGTQTNSFGTSVATAGDVNGDGYADVVVGAPAHRDGQFHEGQASLYLGSAAGLGSTPAWTAEGNDSERAASLGLSVAAAGDVNGDGYSDVIVGGPADAPAATSGQAVVYLGSPSGLRFYRAWETRGAQHAHYGFATAGAGDVNGDGYGDVVVGAWLHTESELSPEVGRAYVFHGLPSSGPELAVEDTTVDETATAAPIRVVLWPPSAVEVVVSYRTTDGTATAGSDYASASGTLVFQPGETVKTVTVPLFDDALGEPQEEFRLVLSDAAGAVVVHERGQAWIRDDDPASLFVSDATVIEGSGGTTLATFTVSLLRPEREFVSVDYATGDGTATAGSDYQSAAGTLRFGPPQTQRTVTVTVYADALSEGNESFRLNLSAPAGGAVIVDGLGVGTIIDSAAGGYFPITPCRVADTRGPDSPSGGPPLGARTTRSFPVAGQCGIPADAMSAVVNVTAVQPTDLGNLRLFAAGALVPLTSVINFAPNRTRAGHALVNLGAEGRVTIQCNMPAGSTGRTHVVLDAFGYFR